MKVKTRILAVVASILLLLGVTFAFVACDDWQYDLESGTLRGVDETAMRSETSEFVTLKVSDDGIMRDVLMRKDVWATNPFFNMFTDTGYLTGMASPYDKISYLTHDIASATAIYDKLEIQYLRIGGVNYFYDFGHGDDFWEGVFKSPLRPTPLASNVVSEAQKLALKPVTNPTQMGGKERKYFVVESVVKQNWKKETAIVRARVFGSQDTVDLIVRMDSTLYTRVINALSTQDTSDNNLARVFGGVNYKNKWYLVHQV